MAFCGLFLSNDESRGTGDTEPDENGAGEIVATGGDGAGVGEDPAGVVQSLYRLNILQTVSYSYVADYSSLYSLRSCRRYEWLQKKLSSHESL